MHTSLTLALLDESNPRKHPVLAALLYLYCPKAAKLWIAGADPELPFNPVWKALEDRSSGATLAEKLDEYGLSDLRPDVRTFIERVDAFRRIHPHSLTPEKTDLFGGFSIPADRMFANKDALRKHMGGTGKNLLLYVHAWVYLVSDWKDGMKFPTQPLIEMEKVSLVLPGTRRSVTLPVWKWSLEQSGHTRVALSWLMDGEAVYAPQIVAGLLAMAGRAGDKPWKTTPELWALDTRNGRASTLRSRLPENPSLSDIVLAVSDAAMSAPDVPVGALTDVHRCVQCGFHRHCWAGMQRDYLTGEARVSEFAFSFMSQRT